MKKIISLAIAICLAIYIMPGVIAEGDGTANKTVYEDMADKYLEVIKEYSNVANYADRYLNEYEKEMKYVNQQLYVEGVKGFSLKMKYAIVDIAGDGMPELIVAETYCPEFSTDVTSYVTANLYGYKNNKLTNITNDTLGSRNRYYIMDNNMIKNESSNGAADSRFSYYNLDANSVKIKENRMCRANVNGFFDGNKKISEDEYNRLDSLYKLKKLDWYSIHDASGIYDFIIQKTGKEFPISDAAETINTDGKLEIQNCIQLLHNSATAWENNQYDACDLSQLGEVDVANLMVFISHYYQKFVGNSVDSVNSSDDFNNFVKLSDIYNAANTYFGIDINNIFTRLPREDLNKTDKITYIYFGNVKKINGVPCLDVVAKIDTTYFRIPFIYKIYSLGEDCYYVLYKYWQDDEICELIPQTKLTDSIASEGRVGTIKQSYAVIKSRIKNGQKSYYIVNCGANTQSFLSSAELGKYVIKARPNSNIKIDYKRVKDFKTSEEFIKYLSESLSSEVPNDAAKSEITEYVEYATEFVSNTAIKTHMKKLKITSKEIEEAVSKSQSLISEFERLLSEKDIVLNKKTTVNVRISADKASLMKGVTISYDDSLKDCLNNIDGIRVVYDSECQSVYAKSSAILTMQQNNQNSVKLVYKNGKYKIEFFDNDGKNVERISAPVTFAFHINSKYDAVYFYNGDDKLNWGGQINETDNTVEFTTSGAGYYSVEKNKPDISDISKLSEEQQEAIKFMISRGYFELNDGKFNPYNSLSRYEFTKSLVNIFYALEFNAVCTFKDVPENNNYYRYVASSEHNDIVKGFDDHAFKGDKNATKEEVISIAARTLAEKKNYFYPENTEEYIQFADNVDIAGWENQYGEIALSVREGLINKGGLLAPKSNITRAEAAVILYRLFNCLYETSSLQIKNQSTDTFLTVNMIVIISGSVLVIGFGLIFIYFRKKSKKRNCKLTEKK